MLRKTPPLESVEIFVAAARGESFRAVARALALSPSAVSRRIGALEDFLGARLFYRSGPRPQLSAAGRRYLELVEPGLRAITDATDDLIRPEEGRLRIATSHSFASIWLLPRLPDLFKKTGIDVELIISRDFDILKSRAAQISIWGGKIAPEGLASRRLFDVNAIPVSAERLSDGRPAPARTDSLADFPLVDVSSPANIWTRWPGMSPGRVRTFETMQMMYEATAAGLGVALAIPLLSEPFLAGGRLKACQGRPERLGLSYDLYRLIDQPARSAEKVFTNWLEDAVQTSVDVFERCWRADISGQDAQSASPAPASPPWAGLDTTS